MAKRKFKAESKRLLDMMINSIYTHREIFLRELVSNASDAIDKMYYKALTNEKMDFNKSDYFIKVMVDKENRTLTLRDMGIGMSKEELADNLGTIAKSGSFDFKNEKEVKDGIDIIGQFGVGFYAAFMVADHVTVISKSAETLETHKWDSDGSDGYSIESFEKDEIGTDIILHIKENTEDVDFDEYLNEFKLKTIIKKYSDFIRYPIKMDIKSSKLVDGKEDEYEDVFEEEIINAMVPIWKKNKSELTEEDYVNFYKEKSYGFDEPIKYIHTSVEGNISYKSILFIPESMPYDYYSKEYEKGLELYSSGVLIMNKCADLLPDYFSFVKGMVDSEDLTLNLSREVLQHDRQLKMIAKNIKNKVKKELENLIKNDREKYDKFYTAFGRQLKYGLYENYGSNKEELKDLIMFYSSKEKKLVTLKEYVVNMQLDQKYIYYAAGESVERIDRMPQTELLKDKGFEVLYFTDEVDEFSIKMLMNYDEKEFKSVSSGDLGIEQDETEKEKVELEETENVELFDYMKELLKDKVKDVRISKILKHHPVCLTNEGDISIEMEKILSAMPNDQSVKADKILELNMNHKVFNTLKTVFKEDKEQLSVYTDLLYNQALLIEGLPIEDPVMFTENIWKIMK